MRSADVYCPPDGTYTVLRPGKYDGRQLHPGDMLPDDCTARNLPMRLERLVTQRKIALQTTAQPEAATASAPRPTQTAAPEPEPTAAAPPVPEQQAGITQAELMQLTVSELQALCKEKGLNHVGNKSQLRKRLATALVR